MNVLLESSNQRIDESIARAADLPGGADSASVAIINGRDMDKTGPPRSDAAGGRGITDAARIRSPA